VVADNVSAATSHTRKQLSKPSIRDRPDMGYVRDMELCRAWHNGDYVQLRIM
jgi:hypothetical protein